MRAYNEAIFRETGIENIATIIEKPSMESFSAMCKHEAVRILLVTGGPGVVKAAIKAAATKAGAVVVNTMPMLRAGELAKIVDKAEISHALCDTRLMEDLVACGRDSRFLRTIVGFDGTANHDAELDRVALRKPVRFEAVATARDDVALLGFTSGTTGEPKATMHFHRDLLVIADGYAREVLGVTPGDIFVGSPPLAFTFGLGGLAIFPLRFGAAAALLEQASPQNMIEIIETHRATVCFTAPTAYRVMLKAMAEGADLSSLRAAVSEAHKNIAAFARRSRRRGWSARNSHGASVGEKFDPFTRVGIYIPGGTAPLVSTALMTITLAQASPANAELSAIASKTG